MQKKDYYEILEVSRNASDEVIKTAYRSLVKKYHPDNTGNFKDDKKIIEIKEAYNILINPITRKEYDESLNSDNEDMYSTKDSNMSVSPDSNNVENNKEKRKLLIYFIVFAFLIWGIKNIQFNVDSTTMTEEVDVLISVQRTGNILTNIGDLEVWIDEERVFEVDGNSTNSVVIMMPVGKHTIQVKGQGDKSKKMKFNVKKEGENEFYFAAEISNWYGVKLEKRKYIPSS